MLKAIPTLHHLSRLYFELQRHGALCTGEKRSWPYHPTSSEELFCLAAEMSRYDPRLITILVMMLKQHWKKFNPTFLRSFYALMKTPQTIAVITEFLLIHEKQDHELSFFCNYLQRGFTPVPLQFYFHHLYLPAGHLADRAAQTPLAEYKKWGFLGREAPTIDEKTRRTAGTFDRATRRNILLHLLQTKKTLHLADYLQACGKTISRQQALLDLKTSGLVKMTGKGKGALWKKAA